MGPRVLLLLFSPMEPKRSADTCMQSMQSCNQAIRRISLTAHRRGATKPYPLPDGQVSRTPDLWCR